MFEKLLSALPYNPSLVHQLGFYAKRMRREESVRRTGLVFIVLSFFVQFFAVVAPPVATVAYSTNDMINGGVQGPGITDTESKTKIVGACRDNTKSYGTVLADFGISCNDVASNSTTIVSINSTDYNKQLYSMGWISYGSVNSSTGKPTDQQVIRPYGVPAADQPLYARYLWSFDSADHSTYKALKVTASTGKTYFILFSCGNLVAIHPPDLLQRCQYDQSILASDSKCFQPCQYNSTIPASSSNCFKPCQYNKTIPASSPQCFAPCPLPGKSNLPQNSPQCVATCPYNGSLQANSPQCFQPCQYNSAIPASSLQCYPVCQYNASLPANSPNCFQPCPYSPQISSSDSQCKPCDKAVSSENALACISLSKEAADQTHAFADPNNPGAQAGDVIKYTLHTTNSGKAVVPKFTMQENLSDVLDYAIVKDLDGGSIDSNNLVAWPAQDIPASGVETHTITVQVKDPIPNTPPDPGDPGHFDHIMTNTYGNTINIKLPGSIVTAVVTTSSSLPNTGPGSSLIIGAAITIVAGYFFARARLLHDESIIAVQQTASHGGM